MLIPRLVSQSPCRNARDLFARPRKFEDDPAGQFLFPLFRAKRETRHDLLLHFVEGRQTPRSSF